MRNNVPRLGNLLLCWWVVVSCGARFGAQAAYTNEWIVELAESADPDYVAALHDFENLGQIHSEHVGNVYHFRHRVLEKRHEEHQSHVTNALNNHHLIKKSEQNELLELEKRGVLERWEEGKERRKKSEELYNDPIWKDQWFINSEDSGPFAGYGYNVDVQSAWDMGYDGSGVVVCVIDDGVEIEHEDLRDNYDPLASYDLQDDDNDPSPRYASNEPNRHGTRCAGEIAGARNNSVCGVGIAFKSNIGGIRILDGSVTRIMESKALGFNIGYVDIFSASWGPPDNGKSMNGPQGITALVLEQAMIKGRGGKGTLYVWAGGNGGKNDDCNADGYQTMRYSISISAVGLNGDTPYYAEPCASSLASTFSSGYVHSIATTDIHGQCTKSHSGTSAAAPIAAGIVALALQANSELTWRDMQHIILRAAVPDLLFHHVGWVRNAAGRATHINFGYGIMDATNMVKLAANWTNVEEDHHCQSPKLTYNRAIPAGETVTFNIEFDGCNGTNNTIGSLEHVYVEVDIYTEKRGDISIDITSPSGTSIRLISTRRYDDDRVGFKNWRLNTVFLFGEDPAGTWTIAISNEGKFIAELNSMFLDVYGTEEPPVEPEIDIRQSTDESVCNTLCELAEHAYYDSASRCKRCNDVVKVDVERRNRINFAK